MKQIIALTICLATMGASFAQQKTTTTKATVNPHKTGLMGDIRDARNHPIKGVQTFLYAADSSIASSGYTDSVGHYETNFTAPGKYNLKVVYPNDKTVSVVGVTLNKRGLTELSIKMNLPASDTSLSLAELMPKPVEKKKGKKHPDGAYHY